MDAIAERCRPYEEELSALVDRELDAARAAAVEAHVAGCAACTERLRALRTTDAKLVTFAQRTGASDADRLARVRRAIDAAPRTVESIDVRQRAPRRRRIAAPLVAAALAASAAGLYLAMRPTAVPAPPAIEIAAPAAPAPAAPDPTALAAASSRVAASEAFEGKGASASGEVEPSPLTPPPPPAGDAIAIDRADDAELALAADLQDLRVESRLDLEVIERLDLLERLDALDATSPGSG